MKPSLLFTKALVDRRDAARAQQRVGPGVRLIGRDWRAEQHVELGHEDLANAEVGLGIEDAVLGESPGVRQQATAVPLACGAGDLVGDLPALADVMEHDFEAEFLLHAEHGEDVVVAVGVVLDDAFAVEHVDEHLHREVTRGEFLGVALGALDLGLVFLGLDELVADERGGLGAGAGEVAGAAHGVGAVGHLEAAGGGAVGELDEQVVDDAAVAQLQVEGLAADEMAGAGHDVDGGEAAGLRLLDGVVLHVDGIEHAHVGLDGVGAVGPGAAADVAVRVDEAGHEDLAGDVDALDVGREADGGRIADGDDLAVLHEEDAVLDRRGVDGEDACADEGGGLFLRAEADSQARERRPG